MNILYLENEQVFSSICLLFVLRHSKIFKAYRLLINLVSYSEVFVIQTFIPIFEDLLIFSQTISATMLLAMALTTFLSILEILILSTELFQFLTLHY